MTFMNTDANIKSFEMIRFVNENCDDDHVISKISVVLRRDKIETPYFMNTKIKMSTCIDRHENGLIHAMDMVSHNRMHNLSKEKYEEIKSLIENADYESDLASITRKENQLKISLIARNDEETQVLFEKYGELFEKIDSLVD